MTISLPVRAIGLSDDDKETLEALLKVWQRKRRNNLLLSVYYDSEQPLRDLGISLPPAMRTVKAALGWPQKAVSALARKHVFEGFSAGGNTDPFEVNEILERNRFELELTQSISSAYKHSCAFLTVLSGDESDGEPPVMVQARDAENSAAIWDKRRREISSFLAITETDSDGKPSGAVMMTRTAVYTLTYKFNVWRVAKSQPNRTGRVLAEPIVYDPQLNREFGRSRITREVRYLTDAAVRTMLRTETSAEFYASPQRWAMGADESAFKDKDRWSAVMGRVLALGLNENGEAATVGQFPQMTMEPHLSQYRQLAQNFCAATGLPQSSVGLFADNPASAEAMQAAEVALSDEAEYQWRVFRPQLVRVLQNVWMFANNEHTPPAESWGVNVNWTPARYVSPQAASDWAVKAAAVDPGLAGTSVLRRRLGLSQGEIEELQSEARLSAAPSVLDRVLARQNTPPATESEPPATDTE